MTWKGLLAFELLIRDAALGDNFFSQEPVKERVLEV
jgi:hypothetical protein